MATPQEWDISAAIKDAEKRKKILSTLKDGSADLPFSLAVGILRRFDEIKYLADLLPAITYFTAHWNDLRPETKQAFGFDR